MYGGPLAAVDQTTAYLGGSYAATDLIAVGRTSDAGRTWHNEPAIGGLHLSGVAGFPGFALSFVSAQQGWQVASTPSTAASGAPGRRKGVILFTRDGGRTWHQ
jgi:photosystem II stability/assembly factor-like uncharacterized protein